jgi:cytochrome c553
MTKISTVTLLTLGLLALMAFLPQSATATKALAQQEDLTCTSCHDKPGSKLLTDKGKYFELMGSLDGYDQIQTQFEKCTTCHVSKPGSEKLTKTGKKYQWVAGDMAGLQIWLMDQHPTPAERLEDQEEEN